MSVQSSSSGIKTTTTDLSESYTRSNLDAEIRTQALMS